MEIRNTDLKGRGLFASRNYREKEIIYVEYSNIYMGEQWKANEVDLTNLEGLILKQYKYINREDDFFNDYADEITSYNIEGETVRERFEKNSFNVGFGYITTGKVLFDDASLFNHSCAPNCQYIVFPTKIQVYALRPIEAGEELTILYQEVNFDCLCDKCLYGKDDRSYFEWSLKYSHELTNFPKIFASMPIEKDKKALVRFIAFSCKEDDLTMKLYKSIFIFILRISCGISYNLREMINLDSYTRDYILLLVNLFDYDERPFITYFS